MGPKCPLCACIFGIMTGNQPKDGEMQVDYDQKPLPGYEKCGSIIIQYTFHDGTQEVRV